MNLEASPTDTELPPLILIHGWWGGSWVWDSFAEMFAAHGFRCYRPDLRGARGELTEAEVGRISVEDHVREVVQWIDQYPDAVLIGHSFGGLLIQKALERRRVSAVVLLAPAAPRGVFSLRSRALLMHAVRLIPKMFGGKTFLPGRKAMLQLNLNRLPAELQQSVLDQMRPASGRQLLETAVFGVPVEVNQKTPMLVVYGSEDRLTPPSIGKAIAKKYDATLRLYPEHGHYLMQEPGSEQIVDDVCRWIRQHSENAAQVAS